MTGAIGHVTLPDGVRLEYEERGDPDGVPVLLLHGVTDSRRSWEPVLPHLPSSIRAIALSQRGHGDSDRPDAGYTIEDMAGDAAAVIDALGLGPAIVVGHSMGGWVAQRLAIENPERVHATLLEAAPGAPRHDAEFVAFLEEMAGMPGPVDAELAQEFQLGTTERPLPDEMLELFVAESLKLPTPLWRELFGGFVDIDLYEGLASLEPPALLVWGDRDALVTRDAQDRLIETIPQARLVVYEGTGHAVHWEEPERFASDLAAFALTQGRSRMMSSSESSSPSKRALTA
jgi:pimeloyl-ACP methyl ester carboxylesterase